MRIGQLQRAHGVARRAHEAEQRRHASLVEVRAKMVGRIEELRRSLHEALSTKTQDAREEIQFRADYERARVKSAAEINRISEELTVFEREVLDPSAELVREAAIRRRSIAKLIERRIEEARVAERKLDQVASDEAAVIGFIQK